MWGDADGVGVHSQAGSRSTVDFDAVGEFSLFDQIINVTLGAVSRIGADVPLILERERAHSCFGGVDYDLNHVLRIDLIGPAFDSLKVLFEPFEDRFHSFTCPLPIHVEVHAAF